MSYHKSKELLSPILNLLNTENYISIPEIISKLASIFQLDEDFLNKRYEVSNAKIFENTVMWKLNDLEKSGLISFIKKEKLRKYIITDLGKEYLNCSNDELARFININYHRNKQKTAKRIEILTTIETEETPLSLLESSYKEIRAQVYNDILDTILSKSPKAFENLVTQLLQKMGYGDGQVTQVSRDGGIDARIKGDILGFEQIYVQAKRYQKDKSIGRPEIQGFTGALLGLEGNATKGVFITTAKFSQDAENFAKNFSKARIVLIDGNLLAKYIYEYELGVQIEKEFSIKKLDSDFWDNIPNDEIN
ncbi:restriction endonuclease [Rodentibacter caecimuris]|uniref:restriction endonuclease n=1 Tax=Rodentibacter caecimuris TaxID=1796644 RepID=UPI0013A081F8|nr:restriction endonuclease [Rodentibacter heylii]MCX2962199.1 restriction endonuclease [Rodentibacter heylii]QIA78069.1 restriction endonuclease [Rodentibacter heylii]